MREKWREQVRRGLSCLLVGLLCAPGFALGAPSRAETHKLAPLVLAFSPLPPWKVIDAQGQPSGPYLDIVRALSRRLGVPLVVRPCPLKRCLALLSRGDADIGIGIAPGAGREALMDYLQPAFAEGSTIGFYRRRNQSVSIRQYGDLRQVRIGVTEGANYFARFDQDNSLQKDFAPDKSSNLRKLMAGRVDVAAMVCGEAEVLLQQPEFKNRIVLAGPPVVTVPRDIVLSRASRFYGNKARIEQALRRLVASGDIKRILAPIEGRRDAQMPTP
jgi:polar amino acid transport system substrate-binding protein